MKTRTEMKPLTAEAWIVVRLLVHASKTPSTFYANPEIVRAVLYLAMEYGMSEMDKAFKAIRKELK